MHLKALIYITNNKAKTEDELTKVCTNWPIKYELTKWERTEYEVTEKWV